jgi:hypothetical protein
MKSTFLFVPAVMAVFAAAPAMAQYGQTPAGTAASPAGQANGSSAGANAGANAGVNTSATVAPYSSSLPDASTGATGNASATQTNPDGTPRRTGPTRGTNAKAPVPGVAPTPGTTTGPLTGSGYVPPSTGANVGAGATAP